MCAGWLIASALLSTWPAAPLQGGPVALRMAKQAISLGAELDLHSGLQLEGACYAQVGG